MGGVLNLNSWSNLECLILHARDTCMQHFFKFLYVNGNAKKVVSVGKQYAVRKAKTRPNAMNRLQIQKYAVRKGGAFTLISSIRYWYETTKLF